MNAVTEFKDVIELGDTLGALADRLCVASELLAVEADTGGFPLLQSIETRRGLHTMLVETISTLRGAVAIL